jgi:transcriptional regulator with XRE-family HTH domain
MVRKSSAELIGMAARAIIEHMERGEQAELARRMGISKQAMSDLANGRRKWTDRYRDSFAMVTGMNLSEVYQLGEALERGDAYFPHIREVANTLPRSPERAKVIGAIVEQKYHIDEGGGDVVAALAPTLMKRYIEGGMGDGELLAGLEGTLRVVLKKYL